MFSIARGKTRPAQPSPPHAGDAIVMESSGGLLTHRSHRWQMGEWRAAIRQLSFQTHTHSIWACPYTTIGSFEIEDLPYSFGIKPTLRIEYGLHPDRKMVWLIVPNLVTWQKRLRCFVFPQPLTEEQVCQIAKGLDPISESVVWHLWEKNHATVDELAMAGHIDDPAVIIQKIKEIINPVSETQLGFSLCEFHEKKVDTRSSETIINSWWITNPMQEGI